MQTGSELVDTENTELKMREQVAGLQKAELEMMDHLKVVAKSMLF